MTTSDAGAPQDNPLVGIWAVDQNSERITLLCRSDGRYQFDTRSTDPDLDYSSTERGRYASDGQTLTLRPYDYFGDPEARTYGLQVVGDALTLTTLDPPHSDVYQRQPGSAAAVLQQEHVAAVLVRRWQRRIPFAGLEEYTFRPGGYYIVRAIPEDTTFPADVVRGRYEEAGAQLTLKPYGEGTTQYELDFFGTTLTLIKKDDSSGQSATYDEIPGSGDEIRAKADQAAAFLNQESWQVGIWEIRDAIQTVDLTIRPDGHYISNETTPSLPGVVHGRYTLAARRMQLTPFIGQDLYARSNGEFGKVERTRELDYYDGELQFIDLDAIDQSVTIARQRPDSRALVLDKAQQAQAERARDQWYVGIWQVDDPVGWMELTLRPDGRYIGKAGVQGVPSQVERGRYLVAGDKATLEPYSGLGSSRGFEIDLYDGELLLIGDLTRLVIARKIPDSETGVVAKTRDPEAARGERGTILGRWTANMPGVSAELVFRSDGQFRETRCDNGVLARDYGLYDVDMATRTLVYDSRFVDVQTLGLDFYGSTLTLFGGLGPPRTFTVNLGAVDQAIATSLAADAAEAQVDAQWLARVPIGPRDPGAVQAATGDVPADPSPTHLFDAPTVLTTFALYRRLLPGLVYFNEWGTIRTVPVVNSREWYLFPTGRALVRFRNYRAGLSYPTTTVDISDSWAAYRVEPRSDQRDILHLYADNLVVIESDVGEQAELTLEDGRRTLFWGKADQILSEWASEQRPEPCQVSQPADPSLTNTGLALTTSIAPDTIPEATRSDGSRPS